MKTSQRELLDVAVEAAVEAGKITLQYYQTASLRAEIKEDLSPVTIADRRAEEHLRALITARYPSHAILGEEGGARAGSDEVTWILDPIDGTKTFLRGVPFYGVLIGIRIGESVDVGVAHFPALGETYWAARGMGSYWNGRRMRVSPVSDLSEALLLTTNAQFFDREAEREKGDAWRRLRGAVKMERTWGDCYGHMLVASGRAEVMVDPKMSPWDAAALQPIVEEAGGVFTDWAGTPTAFGGSVVSTNMAVRGAVTELL